VAHSFAWRSLKLPVVRPLNDSPETAHTSPPLSLELSAQLLTKVSVDAAVGFIVLAA